MIVLTDIDNPGVLATIVDAGARGLVDKTSPRHELLNAIQKVAMGRLYFCRSMRMALDALCERNGLAPRISPREADVVRMFAKGLTVSEIAVRLSRSVKTISRQKADAMRKLGVQNNAQLYLYARQNGLMRPGQTRMRGPPPGGAGSDRLVGIDGPRDGSGDASVTEDSRGLALGAAAASDGDRAVAVGGDSAATADRATAIGGNARAQAANGTALGANTSIAAGAENAVAVGKGATVAGGGGTAVGQGASVSAGNAVALGQGSVADRVSTVSVGTVGGERQITNVAAGTAATDAVNVSQLNAGLERATQSANAYTDQRLGQMQSDIWEVDRGYRAGVASAMAVAGLPQAYQPGRSMIAAAVSGYEQEAGVAVGITTVSDSGRWVYKFSGTTNTRNDVGITMGAGLQW